MSSVRWVPDHSATRCFQCGESFSFLTRRHHCRVCGRIFCYQCTNHYMKIPHIFNTIESPKTSWMWNNASNDVVVGSPTDRRSSFMLRDTPCLSEEKRVCNKCHKIITIHMDQQQIVTILLLLGPYGIGPPEWEHCWYIDREWRNACQFLFHQWENITNIMPYQRPSKVQKQILQSMVHFLSPTHLWWTTLASRENITIPKNFFHLSCQHMKCKWDCAKLPPIIHAVVSLIFGERDVAIRNFSKVSSDSVYLCINILASATMRDHYLIADVLVPLLKDDEKGAMMVYFALKGRSEEVANIFLKYLSTEVQHEISKSNTWLATMVDVWHANEGDRGTCAMKFTEAARLPMNPDIVVVKILHANIIQKKSSSQPTVIPCHCVNVNGSHRFVKCFMMKSENVFPDAFVMEFMRMLNSFLENDTTYYEHVIYDVLPITPQSGILSLVPGCRTLYSLYNENGMTLQNWVMENNTNFSVDHIRSRFVRSCAFATTVSMMLQVGDRHLENILMTRQGLLFHVDFSMILGREPHVKSIIGNTCRITPQMVDFFGGIHSTYYKNFQNSCGSIYSTSRKWVIPLYACMMALVYDNYCSQVELEIFVKQVFCPNAKSTTARVKVENRVDRESTGQGRTWSNTVTDTIHHVFNVFR